MKKNQIVNDTDLKNLLKKDTIIQLIQTLYGNPPNWQRDLGFITLSKIILEQQVSLESARSHFNKLNTYLEEFSPENILKISDEEMRKCFISRQKSNYLKELSYAILSGNLNLDALHKLESHEIREKLTSVKGIGNWTVDVYLLFSLQNKDIFPIGDIAVINAIKELYEVTTKHEIIEIADNWRPFRSLGTYFMWHYYLNKRKRLIVFN